MFKNYNLSYKLTFLMWYTCIRVTMVTRFNQLVYCTVKSCLGSIITVKWFAIEYLLAVKLRFHLPTKWCVATCHNGYWVKKNSVGTVTLLAICCFLDLPTELLEILYTTKCYANSVYSTTVQSIFNYNIKITSSSVIRWIFLVKKTFNL